MSSLHVPVGVTTTENIVTDYNEKRPTTDFYVI